MADPDIIKTIECRVGRDFRTHILFINELENLSGEIAEAIAKKLKIAPEELHGLTANLTDLRKKSKYGGGNHGLTSKILKLKLKISIENCELANDEEVGTKKEDSE